MSLLAVDFKQLSVLRRGFQRISKKQTRILNDVLDEMQLDAVNLAKRISPVDTGRLRRSIGPKGKIGLDRDFGSSVNYARDVEFGGKGKKLEEKKGDKKREPSTKRNPRAAVPFLRPAAEKAIETAVPRIKKVLEEEIEDIA